MRESELGECEYVRRVEPTTHVPSACLHQLLPSIITTLFSLLPPSPPSQPSSTLLSTLISPPFFPIPLNPSCPLLVPSFYHVYVRC